MLVMLRNIKKTSTIGSIPFFNTSQTLLRDLLKDELYQYHDNLQYTLEITLIVFLSIDFCEKGISRHAQGNS